MSNTINTINAEEEKITREGAYLKYEYYELFNIDFDAERIVGDILIGNIKVNGWSDQLELAECYVRDLEDEVGVGEDTSKLWDMIKFERDIFLALQPPMVY